MKLSSHLIDFPSRKHQRGFTLIELLIVITIIAILMTMATVGYNKATIAARKAVTISNVSSLVKACINWSVDHGGKLPSPEYPGDYTSDKYPVKGATPAESRPQYWDLTDSGLWLDGVVYARVYIDDDDEARENVRLEDYNPGNAARSRATDGAHLVGTVFESTSSVKNYPSETNWYKHSFAMNANLQYDGLFAETGAENSWLTEKTLGNLEHQANAMLFVDCNDKNVVMAEDIELIRQAAERYGSSVIVGYVGGRVEAMRANEIPDGDPFTDREASWFWRGVSED